MFIKKSVGIAAVLVAGAVAMGAHAFTASNTVPASKAGSGAGAISGYTVSNIAYTNTAGSITQVAFNLDAAAADLLQPSLDPHLAPAFVFHSSPFAID